MKLRSLRIVAALAALFTLSTLLPAAPPPPMGEVTPAIETELKALAARVRGNRDELLSLKPTASQIDRIAANAEDAQKLMAYVEKMFSTLPAGGIPVKPEQTEIEVVKDATGGGYDKAASHFRPDVQIYVVRYVAPGKTAGLTLDGFMRVNATWIIVPKAWRAFEGN